MVVRRLIFELEIRITPIFKNERVFLILCSSYQEGTGADKEIAETKEKVERFSFCTNEVLLNEASPDVHPVCFGHK